MHVHAMAMAPSRRPCRRRVGGAVGGELGLVVHGRQRVEAEHRVDGRHGQRDVGHVGRARHLVGQPEVGEQAAERFGVAAVDGAQVGVVDHLRVGRAYTSRRRCSRWPGRRPRSSGAPRLELLQVGQRLAADVPLADRCAPARCWARRPLGDDAVDAVGRAMCWRSRPMATWATVRASAALMPSSGKAEAWASLPV